MLRWKNQIPWLVCLLRTFPQLAFVESEAVFLVIAASAAFGAFLIVASAVETVTVITENYCWQTARWLG